MLSSVEAALDHFETLRLSGQRGEIADKIVNEIRARLRFLVDVGLNYLTLDRSADTLSGGEAQRVLRLVEASGNNLKDVTVEIPAGLLTCVTGVPAPASRRW